MSNNVTQEDLIDLQDALQDAFSEALEDVVGELVDELRDLRDSFDRLVAELADEDEDEEYTHND